MSKPSKRSPERKLQVVLSVLRGETEATITVVVCDAATVECLIYVGCAGVGRHSRTTPRAGGDVAVRQGRRQPPAPRT